MCYFWLFTVATKIKLKAHILWKVKENSNNNSYWVSYFVLFLSFFPVWSLCVHDWFAAVICDVKRRSDLNTALVKSFGKCTNTTTSPTSTNSTISSVNTTLESNSTSSSEEESGQINRGVEDSSEEENLTPLSLSLYGLFQLSDRKFCDSGYCPSENLCNTSCTGEVLHQKQTQIY